MNKYELKQKVSELFAETRKGGASSQEVRDLIDELAPNEQPSEKDKAIECIKSLSRIEGYTIFKEGLNKTPMLYENIDYIMNYFTELLKELDR